MTVQLCQQYEKYKLQFKNLAAAQIELLETESFQIHMMNQPTLELDSFSENFISEFATVRHNDRYVCGDGSCKITVDCASGNVTIHKG